MIRLTTVLCMFAAFGSGLYLYAEKHRTALLDRDIGRVYRATQVAHERTGLLRAEWALLNEPSRLQDMASRYLALHPMGTVAVRAARGFAKSPAAARGRPAAGQWHRRGSDGGCRALRRRRARGGAGRACRKPAALPRAAGAEAGGT